MKVDIMNAFSNKDAPNRNAVAIGMGKKIDAATSNESVDHQYGRRVESDRSWTVYHMFTGVPARAKGHLMTGLSRSGTTSIMVSLNLRNVRLRKEHTALASLAPNTGEAA